MTKTPREILENLVKTTFHNVSYLSPKEIYDPKPSIDEALVDLAQYEEENKKSDQWILSRVEIDKDWIKDLIGKTGLVTDAGVERIAEGIKIYSPIKLIGEKK